MAIVNGTSGNDTLNGTTSDDGIFGFEGDDTLNGGNGNDTLDGGAGADALNGGANTDTATYANSSAAVNVSLVTNTGTGGDAQGDTLNSIERVIGSAFNDTLASNTSGHVLLGGQGDDVYVVGNQGVVITESLGEGDDEIQTSLATYSMASYDNIERLTYTGSANATLTGNGRDNIITGGIGNDTLSGGTGADTLNGGDGNDTLIGGAGADQLVGGAGTDTASYAGSTAVTINLKTGVHTGDAAGDTFDSIETILGSANNDTFIGDANGNSFNGGAGTLDTIDYSLSDAAVNVNLTTNVVSGGDAEGDTLVNFEKVVGSAYNDTLSSSTSGHTLAGGQGNDTYVVGNAGVTVTEASGEGDDEIQTSLATFTMASFANVERLTYTGSANATLTGNGIDNVITGGIGNDTLSGGAGADTLNGGDGIDTLIGGAGADTLNGGDGIDTVSYAGSGAISINLRTGVHTGDAAGDTFDSIEGFIGSANNDTFAGDANANSFNGGAGALDTIDYSLSEAAVNVNLTTGVLSGGDAQGDILSNIERVVGSGYNDTLASSTSGHALVGGLGDDVFVVGNAGVTVTEASGEGDDEIQTNVATFSMASIANVERLTYTGTANATLTGNGIDNIITGGIGADTIAGGGGNDTLYGGDNNDTLNGGAGADALYGGNGTDTASYGGAAGAVTVNLKTGVHTGEAAGDTFDSIERFVGSTSNDTFYADENATAFNGNTGTVDTVDYSQSGSAVNVNLTAGTATGGDAEGDTYAAIERIVGSNYDDTLASSTTDHRLAGGLGDDTYVIGNVGVIIQENDGEGDDEVLTALTSFSLQTNAFYVERLTYTGTANATLAGNGIDNIITGGIGNDTLQGGGGADTLIGGDGNDTLNGGTGADALNGGDGTDTATYAGATAAVTIDLKAGVNAGEATGDTYDSIERFTGSNFNDTFIGDASGNYFNAGTGTLDTIDYSLSDAAVNVDLTTTVVSGGDAEGDTLIGFERVVGSAYDDTLASATSAHRLEGGLGNDIYVVGNQGVVVIEASSEGDDEIRTALNTYSMASHANIERLTFTGAGNANLTGNGIDNIITGGTGNDTLIGGGGNDQLIGGSGADTLNGGTGADQLIGGDGADTATYVSAVGAVTINLKTGVHTGEAEGDSFDSIEKFVGSSGNDTFVDDSTAWAFDGGAGIVDSIDYSTSTAAVNVNLTAGTGTGGDAEGDTYVNIERVVGSDYDDTLTSSTSGHRLEGGLGNDTYVVGNAGVILSEVNGDGVDEVRTSLGTFSISANGAIENLTYTGAGNATLTGNAADNIITGSTGNDTLNGGAGNDRLIGGNGNDTLLGGAGADQIIGGDGTDTASYSDATTGIVLDFSTGNHAGIAAGDTFDSIEKFVGSGFDDTFIASDEVENLDGGAGVDILDYSTATAGFTFNLSTNTHTGIAAGDVVSNFEVFVGSAYDDTFIGNNFDNIFVGGAGADSFDGGLGIDAVAYTTAVDINLALGTATGDAVGDAYTSIERIIGSNFVDRFTGGSGNDWFEGGEGADIINGGDGNDTIYAAYKTDVGNLAPSQATSDDVINGGNGADTIFGDGMNSSGKIYGDDGNDTIRAAYAKAYGGEGDDTFNDVLFKAYGENGSDTLNGRGVNFELYGGAGEDVLNFGEGEVSNQKGVGYGGEDGDDYYIYTREQVTLGDDGVNGEDVVYLMNMNYRTDVVYQVHGDDLWISSVGDYNDNSVLNGGIIIEDWFNGANTIEKFITKENETIYGWEFFIV